MVVFNVRYLRFKACTQTKNNDTTLFVFESCIMPIYIRRQWKSKYCHVRWLFHSNFPPSVIFISLFVYIYDGDACPTSNEYERRRKKREEKDENQILIELVGGRFSLGGRRNGGEQTNFERVEQVERKPKNIFFCFDVSDAWYVWRFVRSFLFLSFWFAIAFSSISMLILVDLAPRKYWTHFIPWCRRLLTTNRNIKNIFFYWIYF